MRNSPAPLVVFVLLLAFYPSRDIISQCNPPALLPTQECADAPEICLQDACYSTQSTTASDPHSGWCGDNTALHNPQYVLFTAVSTNVIINISVTSCSGGGCGLQSAILEYDPADCEGWDQNDGDVLDCDPGTGAGGVMTLQTNQAMVDSQYLLLIDGCSGQICDYTITFADGVDTPGFTGELTFASTDDDVVCPGQDVWTATTGPQIQEAAGYLWQGVPWPPGSVTSTSPDLNMEIPLNATPGTYQICVTAFTGCDTSEIPQCFDLTVEEILDVNAPSETHCPEDYVAGIQWVSQTITAPGVYTQTFDNPDGCPYDSIKEFISYPEPVVGQIDTVVCATSFDYEGQTYTDAGSYDLFYDNASINGCDSSAMLNLDLIFIDAEATFDCDLGEFVLSANIHEQIPSSATPIYHWTDSDGNFISDLPSPRVFEPGLYNLELSIEINGDTCTYIADPVNIELADIVPPAPLLIEADSMLCELDFPTYLILDEPGVIDIVWSTPNAEPIDGQGSVEVAIDWAGSTGGEVCVYMVNNCGEGPPTCFNVEVLPQPEALFDAPSVVCTDSAAVITFAGNATPDAEFLWDFDGGTIVSGGTGVGPHEVTWPSTGNYDITLHVIEEGCDTSSVIGGIVVESLGTPVINCESDVSSIDFSWSPVNGASGYVVNVLSGQTGGMIVDDTTFVITGLTPGETVEIEVIANGMGACGQTVVIEECIAQSCTAPDSRSISAPDSLCLGDVTGTIDLVGMVEGMPASGTWSGPGIVDAANGVFDPNDPGAGVGQHQIVFEFDFGGCPFSATTTIDVFANPTADFEIDSVLCENESVTVTYLGSATSGADYQWDFGSGTVVSGSGAGPYEVTWPSDGMQSVSLTVAENGCTSEAFTNMVDLRPTLGKPNLTCATSTSSVVFSWSDVPNAIDYEINLLDGASGVEGMQSYDVTGLTPGDSVTIEVIAIGNGICPQTADTLTCFAQNCPMPTFTVTPKDTSICLYAATGILDLDVEVQNGGGTGTWTGPGIIDADEGLFDPNDASTGAGQYTVTYEYVDQGCTFTEEVNITLSDPPESVISNTNLTLSCDNDNELVLDGSMSGPAGIQYLWTTDDGLLLTADNAAQVTAGAPGTYQLLVIDPASGCRDSMAVTLDQDADVPTADAGANGVLTCEVEELMIGGMSSTGPDIEYEWSSGETTATVVVTEPGLYELTVTNTSNGCFSRDEVDITEDKETPVPMVNVTGILDCDTDVIDLTSTVTGGSGNYTYAWSTANGAIQGSATAQDIAATSAGMYKLIVTDTQNGCIDSIEVEVMADDDVITDIDVVLDTPACAGDTDGAISVLSVIGGSPPYDYEWNTGATSTEITGLGPGAYGVTIVDQNGCRYQRSFEIPAVEEVSANIGADITVNRGDSVRIELSTNIEPQNLDTIIWSGPFAQCVQCSEVVFTAETPGQVMVQVVDINGCMATASLQLNVAFPKNLYIPNIFTPNGDEVNDRFTIYGNTISQISSMEVFDRWGELVYSTSGSIPANNPEIGWDGRLGGENLMPGVYVFKAELVYTDETTETIYGDITLIR